MMKNILVTLIVIGLLIPIIPFNYVQAGSETFPTYTVQNTMISITFSYPDIINWKDNISVPVSVSVIFNNLSIAYVSIWKTRLRIVENTANPMPWEPDELYSYAFGGEETQNPFFEPLYLLQNPGQINFVRRVEFEMTNLTWVSTLESSVKAKLFLEISLTLVAENGARYSRTIYLHSGQLPTLTIQSAGNSHPTNDHPISLANLAIIIVIIAVSILVIVVIYKRRK